MPKKLQDYLPRIKSPRQQIHLPFNSLSSSKNWILSGCKHRPKTSSFAIDGRHEAHRSGHDNKNDDDAATLSDIDRFLFENFKSLYLKEDEDGKSAERVSEEKHEAPKLGPILFDSPRFFDLPPDLCGSNRFFVTPALSGSLMEEAPSSMTTTGDEAGSSSTSTTTLNDSSNSHEHDHNSQNQAMEDTLPHNFIAVLTYSPSPYEDFRRSMQDMVEARFKNHERVDWDFMEELLFCYLTLNDKKSHKFILSAFVDLIVVLRRRSERVPGKPRSVRTVRIGREIRRKNMKEVTLEYGSST